MTRRRHSPTTFAPLAALFFCSCQSPSYGDWLSQLSPDSACYEVNLIDGIDEGDTHEFDALFDCFNHQQHFEAFVPLSDLSGTAATPQGEAIGIELAKGLNQVPWMSFITGLGSGERTVTLDSNTDDYVLELLTGTSATTSKLPGFPIQDAMASGVSSHLAPLVPRMIRAVDQHVEARVQLANALRHPEVPKIWATLSRFNESTTPSVINLLDDVGPTFGEAVIRTQDNQNNRWELSAPGSVPGLLSPAIDTGWLATHRSTWQTLLDDRMVVTALLQETVDLYTEGLFVPAGRELHGLVQVDGEGGTLQTGEASAFEVVARLVHRTDRPIRCSVDVWLGELDVSVNNAAVELLETVAEMEPDDAISTGNWISSILGVGVSESLLNLIVNSNLCEGLSQELVDDLSTLEFLFSERNEALAESFIRILHTFKTQNAGDSRIPEVVALISSSYSENLTRPAEELLRDVLDDALVAHIGHGLSILNDIDAYDLTRDTDDFTFEKSLDILAWLFTKSGTTSPFDDALPLIEEVVDSQEFWQIVYTWAQLMTDPRAQWSKPVSIIPRIQNPNDGSNTLEPLAKWIECTECVTPWLHIGSSDEFNQQLFTQESAIEGIHTPMEFIARLLIDDTLDDLQEILQYVLRTLEKPIEE